MLPIGKDVALPGHQQHFADFTVIGVPTHSQLQSQVGCSQRVTFQVVGGKWRNDETTDTWDTYWLLIALLDPHTLQG